MDVADQANRRGVEIRPDGHGLILDAFHHRLDLEVFLQRFATAPMNVAHRRADLSIRIPVNLFLEEIDQPAVALQHGQNSQVGTVGRGLKQRLHATGESGVS